MQWDNPHPVIRIRGVDISLNATAINEALEVPEVPNYEYETRLREIDLEWLRDTLVEPTRWDQVHWATAEGITSTNWSPDAKRWLHLVTRRIRPSDNLTDVTFPLALVVACAIQGVPLFDADEVLPMDPPLHPLLVRTSSTSRSKRRRRTGRASNSKEAVDSDDEDPILGARVEEDLEAVRKKMGSAYADFTSVPPNTALEVEMSPLPAVSGEEEELSEGPSDDSALEGCKNHVYLCRFWAGDAHSGEG
uniref:Putative plant transposon protein domain-containing protein n=1 Tax=Solanum tuberosum TaxID=4113 RepID=M1DMY5_SOLTU